MTVSVHFTNAQAAPTSGGTYGAVAKYPPSRIANSAQTGFRKAGLLDLPFIYQQIVDGCMEGVFSGSFLPWGGNVELMRLLFANLSPFGNGRQYEFLIYCNGRDAIGFAGLHTSTQNAELKDTVVISFFGIAHEYRGKKYGTQMMRCLVERFPVDVRIAAFATSHATNMKHLLAKTGFRQPVRQPAGFSDCKLRVYLYEPSGLHKHSGSTKNPGRSSAA